MRALAARRPAVDANRFDALTRALSAGNRRGLLGALLTLPWLTGVLALLFDPDDAAAKGRRKRRKKRHKHGKGNGGHRKGQRTGRCKPKSRTRICAGKCGIVKNKQTCKKKINCGSCACEPACDVCFTCQEGPNTFGVCVPDPAQQGETCGEPGQVCQADGACVCVGCFDASEQCQAGTAPQACGVDGETCQTCGSGQFCVDGACKLCLVGSCEPGNTSDCQYATLQEAIDDGDGPATLNLCARTYPGTAHITRDLTLVGAGTEQSSLAGPATDRVLTIAGEVAVTVQNLTVTGGEGGITNSGDLTLRGVTVTGNTTTSGGGGIFNAGTLTVQTGSRVSGNTGGNGGGIFNSGMLTLEDGSLVGGDMPADGNTATDLGGELATSMAR